MNIKNDSPALLNRRVDIKYATLLSFADFLEHIKQEEIKGITLPPDTKALILTTPPWPQGTTTNENR